jgi:hypothetical protein
MNMLFPSTKQRPIPRPQGVNHPQHFKAQIAVNLSANSISSSRKFAAGVFSHEARESQPIHKALSLVDFANQLANS